MTTTWEEIAYGLGVGAGPGTSLPPAPVSWRIVARNRNLVRVAEVTAYSSFDAELFLNQGASWTLALPASLDVAVHLTIGAGIIVYRDGEVVLSGTILERDDEEGPDGDLIELRGLDDTALLAYRSVWPNPEGPTFDNLADYHTGPASSAMAHFVDVNAGPGTVTVGRPERRMPGLNTAADPGIGTTDLYAGNFETLLELMQSVAVRGGGLRFQVKQIGAETVPVIDMPADRTRTVVFSRRRGNVTRLSRKRAAATANAVVVAGAGVAGSRTYRLDSDPDSIAETGIRAEAFIDQRGATSVNELIQAGSEALANGAGGVALEVDVADTESVRFWRDYGLGDRVSVVASDGEAFVGYVSSVRIALGGDEGEVVTPTVTPTTVAPRAGFGGPSGGLAGRLSYLERNPGASPFRAGMGMIWHDAPENIPAGWLLSDGTAGTVDMRERFPIGASASYTLGSAGGTTVIDLRHSHAGASHTHAHGHTGNTLTYTHTHTTPAHAHSHDHTMNHGHSHSHGMAHTHPGGHSHGLPVHVHDYDVNHDHPEFATGDAEGTIGTATSDAIHSGAALSAGSFPVTLENHHHNADPPNLTGTSKTTDVGDNASGGLFTSTDVDTNAHAASPTSTETDAASMTGATGAALASADSGAGVTGSVPGTPSWAGVSSSDSSAATYTTETGVAGESGQNILNPYRAVHFIQYMAVAA